MPKIWVMPVGVDKYGTNPKDRREELDSKIIHEWSVPTESEINDLILFYYTAVKKSLQPTKCIRSIYRITGKKHKSKSEGWVQRDMDMLSEITRISMIEPITLDEIKQDDSLKTALFVKRSVICRTEVEPAHWKRLYNLIIQKNPALEKELAVYIPKKIY